MLRYPPEFWALVPPMSDVSKRSNVACSESLIDMTFSYCSRRKLSFASAPLVTEVLVSDLVSQMPFVRFVAFQLRNACNSVRILLHRASWNISDKVPVNHHHLELPFFAKAFYSPSDVFSFLVLTIESNEKRVLILSLIHI